MDTPKHKTTCTKDKEIKDAILQLFINDDFIFNKHQIIIKEQALNTDINYLIELIYYLTSKSEIVIFPSASGQIK